MRLIDTDKLKFPNIAIFDMKLHGATVPMVRLIDLQMLMPTVDAVPVKHGKWFDAMVGELPVQVCDQCNTFFPLAYTGGGHHYCPNCGAKMDLEENDAKEET